MNKANGLKSMISQDLPEIEELTEAMSQQVDGGTASLILGPGLTAPGGDRAFVAGLTGPIGGTRDRTPTLCGDGFVPDLTDGATIFA